MTLFLPTIVGEDFATTILTVDIHPNVTLISATIPILDDVMTEGVEVFSVVMTSSSEFVLLENHIALVQIVDEDGMHTDYDCVCQSD